MNKRSTTKRLQACTRLFLSLVLVIGLLPIPTVAWGTSQTSKGDAALQVSSDLQAAAAQTDGVDLADPTQWSHMSSYSLAAGGYYYLSDDVTITDAGGILFFAAGETTLDLRGHTLSFGDSESTSGSSTIGLQIGDKSGDPVQLHIVSTTGGTGTIRFCNTESSLRLYETAQVSVDNVDIAKTMTINPGTKGYIVGSGTAAVFLENKNVGTSNLTLQSFTATNCTISTDLSHFVRQSNSDVVSAIYVSSHALYSFALDNVEVSCTAPENVTTTSGSYLNAYAIYSEYADSAQTNVDFVIENSTLHATSLNGEAFGLADMSDSVPAQHTGATYDLQGASNTVALSGGTDGGGWALGVLRDEQNVIRLDSEIQVSSVNASTGDSQKNECDIRIGGELGLSLGSGFSSTRQLGVYAGSDTSHANYDGMPFAINETSMSDDAVAASFFNALYADNLNTCLVSANEGNLVFETNESSPLVALTDSEGTRTQYSSFAAAFKRLESGATISLLTDMPSLDIVAEGETSGTIDLCGHPIGSLSSSSQKPLKVTSSSEGALLQHEITVASGYAGVVASTGTGMLQLENVSIMSTSKESSVRNCAVYVGGKGCVDLDGCTIIASGSSWTAGLVIADAALVIMQNTDISATSDSSNALGLYASSAMTLQSDHCSIKAAASGSNGKADAVRVGGVSSSAASSLSITSSQLSATSDGAWSYGMYVGGSNTKLELSNDEITALVPSGDSATACIALSSIGTGLSGNIKDCTLTANTEDGSASAASICCAMVASGLNANIALSGNVSLASPDGTHIKYGCPVTIEDGTSIVTDDAEELIGTYATERTPGDALFVCGSDTATALQPRIHEQAGSCYENISGDPTGWQLSYDDASQALIWTAEPVATVADKDYPTLQEAVSAANPSETVTVIKDISSSRVVKVSKGITIDLNGHNIELTSESTSGAIVVDASSGQKVVLTNSQGAESGCLTLKLGQSLEQKDLIDGRSAGLGTPYTGIYLKGAADVSLKNISVYTSYDGNANGKAVGIQGIYQGKSAGTLALIEANLDVQAANAVRSYAVYSDATSGEISIDSDSQVTVGNTSTPLLRGVNVNRLLSSDTSTSYSAALVSDGTVKEVSLDASDALYQETCSLFLYEAKFDSKASVYYACPLELSDGTLVWAISDIVPASEIGKTSAMVPTHFYMQASYDITPDAKGIVVGDFSGQITVSGTISVSSSHGEAIALDAGQSKNQSMWSIDGADLRATSGADQDVNVCTGVEPDAGAQLGLEGSWWKNSVATVREVVQRTPRAVLFAGYEGAGEQITLSGQTKLQVEGKNAVAFIVDEDTVEFADSWSLDTSGDVHLGVAGTGRGNVAGTTFATGSVSDAMTDIFYDQTGAHSLVCDAGVLRWDGVCTVNFVDSAGSVIQSTTGVAAGQTVIVPDSSLVERAANETYIYEFLGWSTNAEAEEPDVLAAQGALKFEPIAGQSSVTYYPIYRTSPLQVKAVFSGIHDQPSVSYQVNAGSELQKAISSQDMTAAIPTLTSYRDEQKGITYVPIGWSVSCGDDKRVLTAEAVAQYQPYENITCKAAYMAVGSSQSLVEFVVDGEVYASAVEVGDRPSWTDASGESSPPSHSSYGMTVTFAGWQDANNTYGFSEQLPTVDQTGICLVFTALFDETPSLYDVNFSGVYFKTESGSYAYDASEVKVYCPFGTDPEETLMSGGSTQRSFEQDGYVYTLTGWSTRASDVEPLYQSGDLPTVTPDKRGSLGLVYYAYYDVTPATTTVVFRVDDTVYATASDVETSSTIDAAFRTTGASNPKSTTGEFVGWAATQGATTALTGITQVSKYREEDTDRVTLWAVFKTSSDTSDGQSSSGSDNSSGQTDANSSSSSEASSSSATASQSTTSFYSASTTSSATSIGSATASKSQNATNSANSEGSDDGSDQANGSNSSQGQISGSATDESASIQVDDTAGQGNVWATLFAIILLLLIALFIWWRMHRKNAMFAETETASATETDEEWDQITFDERDFD